MQSTVAAADTGRAIAVVLGENQLDICLAGISRLFAVGIDHHSLVYRVVAGGKETLIALDFHHADTAGADLI